MMHIQATPVIRIPPELRGQIDPNRYQCIKGTEHENVLCASLVVMGRSAGVSLTPANFLQSYVRFVRTLYAGIEVNMKLHPHLKNSRLLKAARGMKGKKDPSLLSKETILKITDFISGNNWEFRNALDAEICVWEARMLLSQFFPNATVEAAG